MHVNPEVAIPGAAGPIPLGQKALLGQNASESRGWGSGVDGGGCTEETNQLGRRV